MTSNLWDAFDHLVRLETVLWTRVDERLRADADVTLGDFNLLVVVDRTDACRVQQLARALQITVGGASQAADRVVRRRLCERKSDPQDRRSSVLCLTALGRGRLEAGRDVADRALSEAFATIGVSDFDHLHRLLRQLRVAAERE